MGLFGNWILLMNPIISGNDSSRKWNSVLARILVVAGFLFALAPLPVRAVDYVPAFNSQPTNTPLDSWSFSDPIYWTNDYGYVPVSFTNLAFSYLGDGQSLVVDTNVPAWLRYHVYESDGTTNLTVNSGSVTFWFAPGSWSSTNLGGTGPGDYGRLLEVGGYTPDSSYGWWSIYVDSGGNNLYFSAQTNDMSSNVTTYVSAPISWTTNYFHFIALTYSPTNTALYLDNVLATNGPGITVYPGSDVLSNGFCIGSDSNGVYQAHGLFNTVQTFNYPLSSNDVETTFYWDYSYYIINPNNIEFMDAASPMALSASTNLWLNPITISNNLATLFVMNSLADILYEVQGTTNLSHPQWVSEGFMSGSELTNLTAAILAVGTTGNLFMRIRSWVDDTGTGIPDWWWLQYFGQITNVNAYAADPAGDGYTDFQKFQMGLNPTNYYNPNAPAGFAGCFDATGTNVFLEWTPAPGPVTNYLVQRGVLNTNGTYVYTPIGTASSNADFFEDAGAISNSNAGNNIYKLVAAYAGGNLTATDSWNVTWYVGDGQFGLPYGPPVPGNVYAYADATGTNVLLSWTPAVGTATNYLVKRGIYNSSTYAYTFYQVASLNIASNAFEVFGGITNVSNWSDEYEVIAGYPGGGLSQPVTTYINAGAATNGTAAPNPFYGYTDGTGTNIDLVWGAAGGTPTNYIILGGVYDSVTYGYDYVPLAKVSASTNTFKVSGAVNGSGGNLYDNYAIEAVYAGGGLSQSASWSPYNGSPAPAALSAYLDSTGTNVVLAWTPTPSGTTGYVLQRSGNYGTTFSTIKTASSSTVSYQDTNGVASASAGLGSMLYQIQTTYPNGGVSPPTTAMVSSPPPAPAALSVSVDSSGTNAVITWTPAVGAVTGYNILRGVYNPSTGTYTYSQIGSVGPSTTSFTDTGAVTGSSLNNNVYQVQAVYPGGSLSALVSSMLAPSSTLPVYNLNVTAQMVRNQTGRWQLMFSGISSNVQAIALTFDIREYWDDLGDFSADLYPFSVETDIPVSTLTNGVYVIPDFLTTNAIVNGFYYNNGGGWDDVDGPVVMVQPIGTNGKYGNQFQAGALTEDEPAFADGRICLKQNLLYKLRAATISQPNIDLTEYFLNTGVYGVPSDTNYVESSFFHYTIMDKGYDDSYPTYIGMDDIWPFNVNYQLHQNLYDPTNSEPSYFVWPGNLAPTPAPAVLGVSDPYWISQGLGNLADIAAYTNSGNLYLQSGYDNLFGLSFTTALVKQSPVTTLPTGSFVALTNVNTFYSQTADPSLSLVNYYFAPVNTPGTFLVGETTPTETYPLPCDLGFASTNQTPLLITSVGTPTTFGGWAKFGISNGSSSKYAYLGQYYVTNAYVLTNGIVTTNTTGVVSPYGDFFPTQAGAVALVTMPDINTGQQGTGIVRVVSLNVDANHDGTMDFTYQGPDFVSPNKPFRFWVNDDQDAGDCGGDGIPGKPGTEADGNNHTDQYGFNNFDGDGLPIYSVHGRRDLVDFFPVYLNIGSLFQSNVLSAGISVTDTNYQFILSQADSVLRFVYTSLTPTNYMNFLRDTNVSGALANTNTTTITSTGVTLTNTFLNGIATNNQGIILIEAASSTTQPLVLTIYHGTNQITQTSLPLSISGVEQMFRHKNVLLNTNLIAMPDRLTDASVPNEPDTTSVNFIFLHGYNVNPTQARGWDADIYKRLYWSGSHAKFYGVTWEAADSQVVGQVTINLQTNIVNAFNTAPLLNTFLNSLNGTNVVAAHSLGNMLVLSTLNDYSNQTINTYFMIDAAVTINAIDTSVGSNPDMYPSAWTNYNGNLWASDWYGLFPTNDYRSSLTWWGRLSNLQNASVYNFYSSGEEVLRDYPTDPPPYLLGIAAGQLVSLWKGDTGEYTWAWQEKLKGLMPANFLLSSDHGGWQFNEAYETYAYLGGSYYWEPESPTTAAALTTSQLQTNAFFNFATQTGFVVFTNDLALETSGGSSYAQANRNRILSDAIPCLTLPLGANADTNLNVEFGGTRNFDMQASYENSWPRGRGAGQYPAGTTFGEWHHSDVRAVAYTFTYKLFNQMATVGNLK
jgi:hypothetical protein